MMNKLNENKKMLSVRDLLNLGIFGKLKYRTAFNNKLRDELLLNKDENMQQMFIKKLSNFLSGIFILIIFITNLTLFGVLYKFHPFILKSHDLSVLLMFGCGISCLVTGYMYFKTFEENNNENN